MTAVFFICGLAFFVIGLALSVYPKKNSHFWLVRNSWLIASGYTADRIDKAAIAAGGFSFILKPVSPKVLLGR